MEPHPEVDELELRGCLLGRIFPELLRLRGCFLLHASGTILEGRAVAFVGPTGAGKSTMAAILHDRGHGIVADDLVVIDFDHQGEPAVHTGIPEIQLLPDTASFMGLPPEFSIEKRSGKRSHRSTGCFSVSPLPLRCIYVLAEGSVRRTRSLRLGEAVMALVRNSYAAGVIQEAETLLRSHFQQCVALAGRIPVLLLERPRSLQELSDVARLVEESSC